jgi:hypothetical protein
MFPDIPNFDDGSYFNQSLANKDFERLQIYQDFNLHFPKETASRNEMFVRSDEISLNFDSSWI